jgi:hypothetical protein
MSEAMPERKSYDMNRYRKAVRSAWFAMQYQYEVYQVYQRLLRVGSTKRFARDPRKWWVLPDDVWPKIEEFERRRERVKGDRL